MEEQGIRYDVCDFSRLEWVKHTLIGFVFCFGMGLLFYQNPWIALMASSGCILYVKEKRVRKVQARKDQLLTQFREAMYALASSLSAGRSVEQAFIQSLKDLRILYPESADILREWQVIVQKIAMNVPMEDALVDFSTRADVEDIHNFVSIFALGKRSGGDLIHIIKETTRLINEKLEIQKEIQVMITQKKFEQQVLSFIIPGMVLFFTLTAPTFLAPLFNGVAGRLIMTAALGMYAMSTVIGRRIVEIEV